MVEILLFCPLCTSTSPFFNFEIVDDHWVSVSCEGCSDHQQDTINQWSIKNHKLASEGELYFVTGVIKKE